MDRQAMIECGLFDGVGAPALAVRLTIDGNNLVAPFQKRVQDALAECLLTVDHNSHRRIPRTFTVFRSDRRA